jgi:fatty acid desaturase
MLLNIASFILVLAFFLSIPGGAWLVFKMQQEPTWVRRMRKPLMIFLLALMATVVICMGITFYEISKIREVLQADIQTYQQ